MRSLGFLLVLACSSTASWAAADDYDGPSGYETTPPSYQLDVAHDGYGGAGRPVETAEPPTYVVVEAEAGTTTEMGGETVIVVQEPEPIAATTEGPPSPRVTPTAEQVAECPLGVWVHGYWDYRNGQYVWVDGHCVEVRVNYVFVHPRWDYYWDTWWFVPGYYRPCGAYVGFGYHRPWHWFPPHHHPYYRSGRAVPVSRSVPRRPTVATPTPAPRVPPSARAIRHTPRVIHRTPSGGTRPISLGRAGTGPVLTDEGLRTRHGVGIVSQPRFNPRPTTGAGRPSLGRSRGFSGGRPRARPASRGSGWQPSSDSSGSSRPSRGWSGGRTRSAPSTGGSSSGSSGDRHGGGSGRSRSK